MEVMDKEWKLEWMRMSLYLSWLDGLSTTTQVLCSTPRGSEFHAEVEKKSFASSFGRYGWTNLW